MSLPLHARETDYPLRLQFCHSTDGGCLAAKYSSNIRCTKMSRHQKKGASCRIGEETHILCFLDEMLPSHLLFRWKPLTCFLIRLIAQIHSPFFLPHVMGQSRTCLSDQVFRTPTVHPRGLVHTPTDDRAAIRAEADGVDP